ncbi:MAG: methyl-accepting chemotaxis protein [Burkholderiales bacterium]
MPFLAISAGLAAKVRWLVVITIIAFGGLTAITLYVDVQAIESERREATRHQVESAHAIIAHYHELQTRGTLSEADAQARALDALRAVRFGDNDYVFVSDLAVRSVMHPIKPELDGKDLSALRDPNGVALFVEFAKVVRAQGAGFVPYHWPRPGQSAPVAKISYVKGFAPWGWVVGSGIYLDDLQRASRVTVLKTVGAFAIVALLTLAGSIVLTRRILRPIRDAVAVARSVAGGDLSSNIEVRSSDETGQLTAALRDMNNSLRDLVGHVQKNALALENESHTLDHSTQAMQAESQSQNRSISSVAHAIEEVTGSAMQVVTTAEQVRTLSQENLAQSRRGTEDGAQLARHITELRDTVSSVGALVARFVESTRAISGMTRQVRDIAEQTNLLALNAAIEAARAGEQGRGFAVVADEVRKLAEKSALAAREIDEVTQRLEQESEAVDAGIRAGVDALDASQTQVLSVADVLNRACDAAVKAAEGVDQIAGAISSQRSAIDDISGHAAQLSSIAQRTLESVEEGAQASGRLNAMARDLRSSVGRFQLG